MAKRVVENGAVAMRELRRVSHSNLDDVQHIQQMTTFVSESVMNRLPSLPKQHAPIFGNAVKRLLFRWAHHRYESKAGVCPQATPPAT